MQRPLIVGVMGGSQCDEATRRAAYQLGALIAEKGWVLLNGGRDRGVMDASARGARDRGGLTIGILPDVSANQASAGIQVAVLTGMGGARNVINVLSSQVVVACPGGAGTLSEIALALKYGRRVILMGFADEAAENIVGLFAEFNERAMLQKVDDPIEAVDRIAKLYPEVA
jgi:uncharacterized protein (TIGR00725 family)